MGIVEKVQANQKANKEVKLTNKEVDFILTKLRTATFLGEEFEQFYNIWVKLTDMKQE